MKTIPSLSTDDLTQYAITVLDAIGMLRPKRILWRCPPGGWGGETEIGAYINSRVYLGAPSRWIGRPWVELAQTVIHEARHAIDCRFDFVDGLEMERRATLAEQRISEYAAEELARRLQLQV